MEDVVGGSLGLLFHTPITYKCDVLYSFLHSLVLLLLMLFSCISMLPTFLFIDYQLMKQVIHYDSLCFVHLESVYFFTKFMPVCIAFRTLIVFSILTYSQ
jgi:hypothetical protein